MIIQKLLQKNMKIKNFDDHRKINEDELNEYNNKKNR